MQRRLCLGLALSTDLGPWRPPRSRLNPCPPRPTSPTGQVCGGGGGGDGAGGEVIEGVEPGMEEDQPGGEESSG